MKQLHSLGVFVALSLLGSACDNQQSLGPNELDSDEMDAHRFGVLHGDGPIKVMTRNLYVGADVDAVLVALTSEDPDDDLPALLTAVETLEKTHFPARAQAVADEIARTTPHVVGLQEVSEIYIDLQGLGLPLVVDLDFLDSLTAALSHRGLNYTVAATVKNIEAVPVIPIPGVVISLVDYDAVLVDADRVRVISALGRTFSSNVGVVAPGVELKRGWVAVEASIRGESYVVVSTHPEPDLDPFDFAELRAAQVLEIVADPVVAAAEQAIIMGDLNDLPGSLMYQVLEGAGFSDVWAVLRPWAVGYTCCHDYDLANVTAHFDERIDYIWSRGIGYRSGGVTGWIYRLGILPFERVAGPYYKIWPSDHAGLVARLRSPRHRIMGWH